MAGHWCELFLASGFLEEPACLWRFEFELEGAIGESSEFDLKWDVSPDMRGDLIELLAEFHHVDAERTQRLTHFGVGLGNTSVDAQVDSGWLRGEVPL